MAVIIGATLLHGVVVLPLILYLVTGVTPLKFWRGAREALVTAFATSSSSATLPVTLRCVEQHLHVKPEIAGFVVPLGATINMDGTALYEAAAGLFIANLVGIDLNLMQQLVVCATAMLAAMGAPGIPSAGMVTMVMVLQSVGLPAEAIAILLPVDRLLDTFERPSMLRVTWWVVWWCRSWCAPPRERFVFSSRSCRRCGRSRGAGQSGLPGREQSSRMDDRG